MTGFGPYVEKTEVNFDELGEQGLYLITGNTGAGKTTIFDAISFALFGKASGKNRDKTMFRSKLADYNTPTEVELYFNYNERSYYVKRNPEYMRNMKNREGTTKQAASAELICPDDRVVTGEKNVNAAIEELIGIDGDQFSQIAMLAQGAFLEMLFSNTSDRKEIFRSIFKTDKFNKLMEKIRKDASKLELELEGKKHDITTHARLIQCEENEVLSLDVEKAGKGEILSSEILCLLERLIAQDKEKEKELGKHICEVEREIEELTKKITQEEELQKKKRLLEEKKLTILGKREEKKKAEEEKKRAEQKKPDAEKKRTRATEISTVLEEYDTLDLNKRNLIIVKESIEILQRDKESLKKFIEDCTEKMDKLKEEQTGLQDVRAEIVALENKQNEYKKALQYVKKGKESFAILLSEERNLEGLQQQCMASMEKCKRASQEYNEKNDRFIAEQAGILAELLRNEENLPCPVCGSTTHPKLAKKSENAPTKEEVRLAKEQLEKEEKKKNELGNRATEAKSKVENIENNLKEQLKELVGKEVEISEAEVILEEKQKEYEAYIKTTGDKLLVTNKKEKRRRELEALVPKTEQQLTDGKKELNDKEIKLTEASKDQAAMEHTIENLISKLEYASKKEAVEKIKELQTEVESMEQEIEKVAKTLNKIIEGIAALEGEKKMLEDSLEGFAAIDVELEKEKQEKLRRTKEELREKKETVVSRRDTNENCKGNIELTQAKIAELEKKYATIKALDKTVNGEVNGKSKITLEAYVQTFYFDRIIRRANQRFLEMTDGHYELVRSTEGNGNTKVGLDLRVKDYYSGSIRDVKSLSGGESFEAALSLALGLADEIEASAGGIQLDVMFVDEGFGSLDEESLDKAIKALQKITESKRLVGIISHVAELKKRIDKQIVVTKEATGESKIQIVT